jgi:TonB family protein
VRCGRPIDQYARLCVYCNWYQAQAYAAQPAATAAAPAYVPPPDNRARNRLLGIGGGVLTIILAFVIGTWMHGFEPKDTSGTTTTSKEAQQSAPAQAPLRSNVTLVPATDAMPAPVLEAPVTSAPPQAPGQQASDATALPSNEYAAVAAKAKAQKQARASAPVDPREVRGSAYEEAPAPAKPQRETEPQQTAENNANPNVPMASSVSHTSAFPEYKPLPDIHVDRDTSARLTLTVGPDGRVTDIDVIDPIPGATSKLIQSVQNWRFKPATENGTPVSARVSVTINLHGNQ